MMVADDNWHSSLLSFIIPIVFFGCRFNRPPYLTWDKYLTTLVITAAIWIGNRYIMIYSRGRYPLFNEVRKRLVFQSVIMFVFTVVANNLLRAYLPMIYLVKTAECLARADILINSNAAAIFCTIMIIAIYESIYFMHQLRHSVEETENAEKRKPESGIECIKNTGKSAFPF